MKKILLIILYIARDKLLHRSAKFVIRKFVKNSYFGGIMSVQIYPVFSIIVAATVFSFTATKKFPDSDKDYGDCVKKVDSKWGEPCEKCEYYVGTKRDFSETYTVYLKNECNEKVDVKCCVQEKDKVIGWRCFTRTALSPNDTLVVYACKSAKGKYLKWVKKSGDNEIVFPSDEDVKKDYKE